MERTDLIYILRTIANGLSAITFALCAITIPLNSSSVCLEVSQGHQFGAPSSTSNSLSRTFGLYLGIAPIGILRLVRQFFQERAVDQGTSAVGEIRRLENREGAWKEQTFLQSRGNKIHTGCIYLPFNSF